VMWSMACDLVGVVSYQVYLPAPIL
jgi:hypothetical protein